MEMNKQLIGIRIMQRRKAQGLTQEDLSEKIGYSKNHISSIERGKFIPTTQFIFKLCNVLGETPDYYLIGKISKETDDISTLCKCLPIDIQQFICAFLKAYLKDSQLMNDTTNLP